MKSVLGLFAGIVVGAAIAAGAAVGTFGASPSQSECEASGGTFSKVNGQVQCTKNVGNSPNSQTVDTTGQGNINNKQECSGPGNSTAKCP